MLKPVRRILVALLLGSMTSIALAWAIAAWWPISVSVPRSSIGAAVCWGRPWHHVEFRQFGVRLRWWNDLEINGRLAAPAPRAVADMIAQLERDRTAGRVNMGAPFRIEADVPNWGSLAQPAPPELAMGSDTAFGWPAPCMWYQVLSTFDAPTMSIVADELRGGVHLRGGPPTGRGAGFYALPLRPIWWGLVINTLFFSALWLVALTAPPMARGALRRRRGLCLRCGYDLQGQFTGGCPECGAGR
ncbi:MAG: hypothetical protein ACF8R7_13875 [Phycisphaerales bacterium JB039]